MSVSETASQIEGENGDFSHLLISPSVIELHSSDSAIALRDEQRARKLKSFAGRYLCVLFGLTLVIVLLARYDEWGLMTKWKGISNQYSDTLIFNDSEIIFKNHLIKKIYSFSNETIKNHPFIYGALIWIQNDRQWSSFDLNISINNYTNPYLSNTSIQTFISNGGQFRSFFYQFGGDSSINGSSMYLFNSNTSISIQFSNCILTAPIQSSPNCTGSVHMEWIQITGPLDHRRPYTMQFIYKSSFLISAISRWHYFFIYPHGTVHRNRFIQNGHWISPFDWMAIKVIQIVPPGDRNCSEWGSMNLFDRSIQMGFMDNSNLNSSLTKWDWINSDPFTMTRHVPRMEWIYESKKIHCQIWRYSHQSGDRRSSPFVMIDKEFSKNKINLNRNKDSFIMIRVWANATEWADENDSEDGFMSINLRWHWNEWATWPAWAIFMCVMIITSLLTVFLCRQRIKLILLGRQKNQMNKKNIYSKNTKKGKDNSISVNELANVGRSQTGIFMGNGSQETLTTYDGGRSSMDETAEYNRYRDFSE